MLNLFSLCSEIETISEGANRFDSSGLLHGIAEAIRGGVTEHDATGGDGGGEEDILQYCLLSLAKAFEVNIGKTI